MSALNMERLSIALGVSLPTLRRWLLIYGDEFPVVRRGSNGRAYEFDLAAVSAFLDAKREARKLAAEKSYMPAVGSRTPRIVIGPSMTAPR